MPSAKLEEIDEGPLSCNRKQPALMSENAEEEMPLMRLAQLTVAQHLERT